MNRIFKSKILMKITEFEKVEGENNETSLKVTKEKWVQIRGKDLENSLKESNRKIEIVYGTPKNFQLGVLYILADGKKAWVYKEN